MVTIYGGVALSETGLPPPRANWTPYRAKRKLHAEGHLHFVIPITCETRSWHPKMIPDATLLFQPAALPDRRRKNPLPRPPPPCPRVRAFSSRPSPSAPACPAHRAFLASFSLVASSLYSFSPFPHIGPATAASCRRRKDNDESIPALVRLYALSHVHPCPPSPSARARTSG